MPDVTKESADGVEVFSQTANAWLHAHVSLLAATGKITVCYSIQGKKCRKHLSPFTKQIRVEDEAEETEEEADPDLSFHQVFRAARRFVLGDFDGSEFSLEKTLEKAAQMERQQRHHELYVHAASASQATMIARQASNNFREFGILFVDQENPEFNESFQRSACKRLSSEAVLFKKRPQASDVAQGGEAHNCGFMAALAAIADHQDGYLVRLLLEEEDDLNQCGCYRVSLFLNTSSRNLQKYRQAHPSLIASEKEVFFSNTRNSIKAEARGSWRTIVVDDIVPDSDGPRACRPKGAVWPSIIEKAFAKACGSYERTNLLTLPTHW
ncbi:Calpain-13 [Durusdinium trenchii]|uniref:Calpain-13 n=1 Tax=Durusdinium trenchii TaxID=1381693 RepID=A0ABP0K8X7_9DINO